MSLGDNPGKHSNTPTRSKPPPEILSSAKDKRGDGVGEASYGSLAGKAQCTGVWFFAYLSECLLHWSESLGIRSSSSWYREGDIHTCLSQILKISLSQNIHIFFFSGEPWLMQMEIQILRKKNKLMEEDSALKT